MSDTMIGDISRRRYITAQPRRKKELFRKREGAFGAARN
jgi:hypothetical protein